MGAQAHSHPVTAAAWPIRLTKRAQKSLKKLERIPQFDDIGRTITELAENSGRLLVGEYKRLEGQTKKPAHECWWRAHVGAYRVIYAVLPSNQILVYDIVHKNAADRSYDLAVKMYVSEVENRLSEANMNLNRIVVANLLEDVATNIEADGADAIADAPAGFFEALKKLPGPKQKMKFIKDQLEYIGKGSSRIVFVLDQSKVLKVAMNAKGIAQNAAEIDISNLYDSIVTQVFEYDDSDEPMWLVAERAIKAKNEDWKRVTGLPFKTVNQYILSEGARHQNQPYVRLDQSLYDNELLLTVSSLIASYDMAAKDLAQAKHWGVVKRDGKEMMVLYDYGATNDVIKEHYRWGVQSSYAYPKSTFTTQLRAILEFHGRNVDLSYDTPSLMEAAAMLILSGLKETNMIQFMLAEQMGKDFLDWAEEFGQKFREIYDHEPEIKRAIDGGQIDKDLLGKVEQMLIGPEHH